MASTGSDGRRGLLRALALTPVAALLRPPRLRAADYASTAEAFAAIDRMEADVAARLEALLRALPACAPFARSVLGDHARQREARARLGERLGVTRSAPLRATPTAPTSLAALREAQQELVYAHAEALPTLGDATAVGVLARHMVELARHLSVIELWIEQERRRG